MNKSPSTYTNRHWEKDNDTYKLFFRPFDEDECILSFTQDKEDPSFYNYTSETLSVEDDFIDATSPEDAMEQFEEMIAEHYQDESNYYNTLLNSFKEKQ